MSGAPAPNPTLTDAIDRLCAGEDLDSSSAEAVLREIMAGRASEVETAGFLIALRGKGETAGELAGLARAMRSLATPVHAAARPLVDTAGTGGGGSTFNVSTTAALIAAGSGIAIAKHGNRSATSRSGSADVLEALGCRIDMTPEETAACIDEIGFGFMFAPGHHEATRWVAPVRIGLGTRTAFNLLGPLTNPAGAQRQIVGVGDRSKLEVVAAALAELGAERAFVVSSEDGLDEFSTAGPTTVCEIADGNVIQRTILPADAGLESAEPADLEGGSPEENAATTSSILAGEHGPRRDLAVFNAAAAILVAGESADFAAAARAAEEAIDSGRAALVLERLVEFGRR